MDHYTIQTMSKDEVNLAINWAKKEGWNPGIYDAHCFYTTDPTGFFAGKLHDKIIAVGSAVIYDANFAFCGLYIVDENYRDLGYGLQLTKRRLEYIGNRNAGIDGVVNMLDKYTRLGYRLAHNNARYKGNNLPCDATSNSSIVPANQVLFSDLVTYDALHFPASRPTFLKCWLAQPESKSFVYIKNGEIGGYGLIRRCYEGFKIGPLFADTTEIAESLFLQLLTHAKGEVCYLDIPENNPAAKDLVQNYQLEKVFETARMYLKSEPQIKNHQIYGITTFELG